MNPGLPRWRSQVSALALPTLLAGCATPVQTVSKPGANFAADHTFALMPLPQTGPASDPGLMLRLAGMAQEATTAALTAKGFQPAEREKADFVVNLRGSSLPRVDVNDWVTMNAKPRINRRHFCFGKPLGAVPALVSLLATVAISTGCRSIGPGTVAHDRFEYSSSISESWKRQTLLNIVKLRYLDPPIFVDVGQIVSGYSFETGISAGGSFPQTTGLGGNTATVGGSAKFTDRPTITYTPLTGNKFVKALMAPLPPDSVFFTMQSGYAADAVFFAAVGAMNGLKNQESNLAGVSPPDADFVRALELLRKIQLSGAVGMRVEQDAQKRLTTLVTFRSKNISEQTLAETCELRKLLRLNPDAMELKLVFGPTASSDMELAILTRSLLNIMNNMAAQVDVPPEHITDGRATPGFNSTSQENEIQRMMRIRSSKEKPAAPYVAVPYRDHWFWIDDRDLKSKRAFAFMMLLFTLSETSEKENLPLITIPAQ
jgi:hypothetical protein